MHKMHRIVGVVAASILAGTTAVQAEGFHSDRQCRSSSFHTCAGVQLHEEAGRVIIGAKNAGRGGWGEEVRTRTFEFVPAGDGVRPGDGNGSSGSVVTCPVPSGNPHDCPPVTTTPEPVSMTLLATGLAGMAFARRKRRSELA